MNGKKFTAALDIGNSSGKVGIFDGDRLHSVHLAKQEKDYPEILKSYSLSHIIAANVGKKEILTELQKHYDIFVFDHTVTTPLKNRYATPETLGADRLAAAVGAWSLFPHQNSLVIDLGTCITYEAVSKAGEYLGGNIVPGLRLRCEAMHRYTANLPLVEVEKPVPLIGKSTVECMQSGVFNGLVAEINGMIATYSSRFEDLKVLTCGGDAFFFESHLKPTIFAASNLVLMGLHAILKEHV